MTNEKVHITIELPRDYRVWDLLDLPGRIVDIAGVEHISGEKYSVPASEALSKPGEWVRHTGTECPVHPLDVVRVKLTDGEMVTAKAADDFYWCELDSDGDIASYRHVRDSDGIPYVYDDGSLPQWAEYVATDEDGDADCYERKPEKGINYWVDMSTDGRIGFANNYANTSVPFTESLRRVWREE